MSHDKPHDCIILWFYLGPCKPFDFLVPIEKFVLCISLYIYIYIYYI